MTDGVLVAVPNISEGRNEALVARIAGEACLLDVHSDPDHNRSVLTYGGEALDVFDACFTMIERAVASLDINEHDGVHPRFGVVDILPFVPYTYAEHALRDDVAQFIWRVGQGPGIPVFTYGRNISLPDLRRRLRQDRPVPHPTAGVLCVGIRDPLIAFNVNVRGTLGAVREAAKALRAMPGVRALAFELKTRGLVQLSMNLTDLDATGPKAAFERASELGLEIVDAEVIGLVPERTLPQFASIFLRKPARSIEAALSG